MDLPDDFLSFPGQLDQPFLGSSHAEDPFADNWEDFLQFDEDIDPTFHPYNPSLLSQSNFLLQSLDGDAPSEFPFEQPSFESYLLPDLSYSSDTTPSSQLYHHHLSPISSSSSGHSISATSDGSLSPSQTSPPPRSGTYKCTTCGRSFPERPLFNRHTKTHTKPKSCPAEGCSYSVAEQRDLHRHLKVHHPDTLEQPPPRPCVQSQSANRQRKALRERTTWYGTSRKFIRSGASRSSVLEPSRPFLFSSAWFYLWVCEQEALDLIPFSG